MFKYISEILSKISQGQRITALIILVAAGVSLVLVPQWLDKKDCKDLFIEVEAQGNQIIQLNRKIVENDSRYTDEKLKREGEIREIISNLSQELDKIKNQSNFFERESKMILQSYTDKMKEDTIVVQGKVISPRVRHLDFSDIENEIRCLNRIIDKQKDN